MLEALRRILWETCGKKGSNITAERLRFDFNHPEKWRRSNPRCGKIVNDAIVADLPVPQRNDQRKPALDATGIFVDKYWRN